MVPLQTLPSKASWRHRRAYRSRGASKKAVFKISPVTHHLLTVDGFGWYASFSATMAAETAAGVGRLAAVYAGQALERRHPAGRLRPRLLNTLGCNSGLHCATPVWTV